MQCVRSDDGKATTGRNSDPDGVDILINDHFVFATVRNESDVSRQYNFRITRPGRYDWHRAVHVQAKEVVEIRAKLTDTAKTTEL